MNVSAILDYLLHIGACNGCVLHFLWVSAFGTLAEMAERTNGPVMTEMFRAGENLKMLGCVAEVTKSSLAL